jgi:hypothetical protein
MLDIAAYDIENVVVDTNRKVTCVFDSVGHMI